MHQVSHGHTNHDPYQFSDTELRYLYGQEEPHYSVPAIQTQTDIRPISVEIWQKKRGQYKNATWQCVAYWSDMHGKCW